jgi:hypothetical protein
VIVRRCGAIVGRLALAGAALGALDALGVPQSKGGRRLTERGLRQHEDRHRQNDTNRHPAHCGKRDQQTTFHTTSIEITWSRPGHEIVKNW